jgi:hypothetical protein
MAILGHAALGFWTDIVPEAEGDFNRWYAEQHFPERLSVPGFLRGRRYQSSRGVPKYFTLYETERPEVLRSPAYMERLNNPTDWTRRVLPNMRNAIRNAYRLLHTVGGEDGRAGVALRIDPASGREKELQRRYQGEVLGELARVPGVLSATLYEAEPVATGVITEERKLVGAVGTAPPFLCFCELEDPGVVDQSPWRTLLGPDGPARKEIASEVTENAYRLIHSLSRPESRPG